MKKQGLYEGRRLGLKPICDAASSIQRTAAPLLLYKLLAAAAKRPIVDPGRPRLTGSIQQLLVCIPLRARAGMHPLVFFWLIFCLFVVAFDADTFADVFALNHLSFECRSACCNCD